MNLKHYHFLLILLFGFIFIFPSCKQSKSLTTQVETPKVNDYQVENSLLWEISGNGLSQSSFLFGTIHIINDEDYFLPGGTLSAIDQSDKIVFEIDMAEMNDLSKQLGLLKDAFMNDGLTLKDLLTDEEYEIVNQHFKKIGMPLFLFERFKPMFLTVFASGDMNPQDLQTGKIKSYEMEFYEMANLSNKAVGGLETIEFQMSVFDSIPYQDQANMLVESIKVADTEGDQFKEMVDIYKNQDLNAMQSMFEEEDTGLQGYEDILLIKRNKNWIPLMEEMMKSQKTFFAVGAGHLGGKYGVIQLLKEAGFTLSPLSKVSNSSS